MQKNIFEGNGLRATFVSLIYDHLMKRKFVSYATILAEYQGKDIDYYKGIKISQEREYGELKKAFKAIKDRFQAENPTWLEDNGIKKGGKAYKYIGDLSDPFCEERNANLQKSIEDYVNFCKESAGLLPPTWFSSFFERTQLLLETNRNKELDTLHINSSLEQNLTNIELLPQLNRAIIQKDVLSFNYQPYGKDKSDITFHPQFLKEYNGRWFVLGKINGSSYYPSIIPIDRIIGDFKIIKDIEYIPAKPGTYKKYFKDIIGVSHEIDEKMEHIVIHTHSEYHHGLLCTKPLHSSQNEILPFGKHGNQIYGEITLDLIPNRELLGHFLTYGSNIELISPMELREKIRDDIEKQINQYR
jgi:hypothetical protein